MSDFAALCTRRARELVVGRSIIIGGFPLAGTTRRVEVFRELGAARCFVLATGVGTGPLPDPSQTESLVVEITARDMMGEFRAFERICADPPCEVAETLDRFDPNHEALLLLASVGASMAIGDRPSYGPRPASWVALEDKTVCDAMFDQADVRRPPSRVVPVDLDALRDAAAALDRGAGTVWSGDASEGFNGGGHAVRWIRDGDDDGTSAFAFFADHCDRVRVAPFVDGLACSVHGFVTDDGVAAFRPVELVNLRRPTGDRMQYAGCATFWDPADADRAEMRAAARRLGEHLRVIVAYRGFFTLDGIMGPDGFVATECNPRPGAGLGYVTTALPEFPLDLVQYLAVAGNAEWLRAGDLEALFLDAGDRVRSGGGWTPITTRFDSTRTERLVHDGAGFRAATDDEAHDATLSLGPGTAGGFIRVDFVSSRTPVGSSVGPRVAAAFAYADAAHGTGIGDLAAAEPAR